MDCFLIESIRRAPPWCIYLERNPARLFWWIGRFFFSFFLPGNLSNVRDNNKKKIETTSPYRRMEFSCAFPAGLIRIFSFWRIPAATWNCFFLWSKWSINQFWYCVSGKHPKIFIFIFWQGNYSEWRHIYKKKDKERNDLCGKGEAMPRRENDSRDGVAQQQHRIILRARRIIMVQQIVRHPDTTRVGGCYAIYIEREKRALARRPWIVKLSHKIARASSTMIIVDRALIVWKKTWPTAKKRRPRSAPLQSLLSALRNSMIEPLWPPITFPRVSLTWAKVFFLVWLCF